MGLVIQSLHGGGRGMVRDGGRGDNNNNNKLTFSQNTPLTPSSFFSAKMRKPRHMSLPRWFRFGGMGSVFACCVCVGGGE